MKRLSILSLFLIIGLLAACAAPAAAPTTSESAPAATMASSSSTIPAAADAALPEGAPFTIGVSNNFVGSEWRTQMIQDLQEANAEFMAQGLTGELVIESADTDAQGQIQQIQNLMNRGVNAIIINPGDQQALNPIIEEAVEQGIVVIAIDQEISAEGALNVVIDQKEWAKISMEWLAEQMGGAGDLVLIEGFPGHPANEARMEGVAEVLAEYPDIKIVGRETGRWDQATGQQVMSNFIASLPNIDGVWTQDGMASGVLQAYITANPAEWPLMSGEARVSYLRLWDEVRKGVNPDFTTIGVVNPPGVAVSGLRVAIELLQGKTVDEAQLTGPFGNTLYVPIPGQVTAENFEEELTNNADRDTSYTLDGMITQEEAAAFMQ